MKNTLSIKRAKSLSDYAETVFLRYIVFVEEQKVPASIELEFEDSCEHFLARDSEGRPAGCVRIRQTKEGLKIERLVVHPFFRGRGYGKALVRFALKRCLGKINVTGKRKTIYMNAQSRLEKFYGSLGFERIGNNFEEAGIPHIRMVFSGK